MGNLYTATSASGRKLIIDPGVTWKKLQRALDYDLSSVDAALCGHAHLDHSKAITEVCRAGIDVYASAGTFEALGVAKWRRTKIVADQVMFTVGEFKVLPFSVVHDVPGALGFVIWEPTTDDYLLFAIDTCLLTQWFIYPFSIIAIGCSFDQDVLQSRVESGDINETLAKRLLVSHGSVQWVRDYLKKFCCLDKCREIHLLHMSGENLDKRAVRDEIEKEFFVKTYI